MPKLKIRVTDPKALAEAHPKLVNELPCRHCEGSGKILKEDREKLYPLVRAKLAIGETVPGIEVLLEAVHGNCSSDLPSVGTDVQESAESIAAWGKKHVKTEEKKDGE